MAREYENAKEKLWQIHSFYQSGGNPEFDVRARAFADVSIQEISRLRSDLEKVLLERELARLERSREPGGVVSLQIEEASSRENRFQARRQEFLTGRGLDFRGQASAALARLMDDYRDAVERISVASIGLRNIYSYNDPYEAELERIKDAQVDSLNDAVRWVRAAIRWLVGFSQLDQTFSIAVSVRRSMGDAKWRACLKKGRGTFDIDDSLFGSHTYVRMRGISGWLRTKDASAVIRCTLTVPEQRWIAKSGRPQWNVPPCTLGRVISSAVPVEPEVCGAVSIVNVSPRAEGNDREGWTIEMSSMTHKDFNSIDDLVVCLLVTGQPKLKETRKPARLRKSPFQRRSLNSRV